MSVAFAGQTPSIELMEEGHGAMSSLALQAPNAIAVQPSSKALNGHAAQEVVNAAVVQMRTTPVGVAKTPPPTVREAASLDGGCLPHYVASLRTAVDALEKSALRHRSLPARDFLARVATGGAYGYDQLEAALEADGSVTSRLRALGPGMLHRRALGALARVVGNQEVTPTDPQRAIALYEAFGDIFEYEKLRPIDHILYVDLLTREGRADEARVALERSDLQRQDAVEYACLLANLIHPGPTPKTGDAQAWLNALNGMHSPSGIEDVFLTDDSGPLIGRFGCNIRGGPINDGPLVSVLMTTFNPDATLDMAVKSVLAQSWRNLELIIVDDCSTDEAFATIKGWEAHDPRVQVVRMEANGGTYVAKNRGLSMARGEFVTCHDSDDWSHPRKLQRQAEQLLANAGEIGNMTSWIRATPSMEIRRFSATGKMLYPNTSSLMFRREPVVRRCGSWDDVRTGADSELYRRIELTFAQTIPVHGDPPLSFGQIRAGALTHETLGNGWESPARKAYRSAWRHWHAHEKDQGVRMESGSPRRKFYAPAALLPSRSAGEARQLEFDVIIGSDFRMAGGNTTSCIEEIKANTRAGLRTAICQMNSFRRGLVGKDFLDSRIMELLRDGQVDQVELEDDVRCRLLLLRYPPILQFVTGLRSGIRAQNVRVIVNQPPAEKDGSDRRYDVGACARHALALFGKPAIWAPIGLLARESVQANLSRAQLARDDWHNVIDVDEWSVARTDFVGDRPVIGRHSRDDVTKWPEDPGIVRAVYPTDGSVQVRVLGGAASVQKVLGLGSAPANWEVFPFDAVAPKEFLSSIDYFVYFHHSQRVEAFGRTIIEAMAAGCVAILPRHFEPIFGDGALYCEPRDVQSLVKALYADKARHFEISLRGVNFVRDHFGYGVHERRVRDIIGEN
ncbi:MAG: glycosyltransferase [Terricaulis sp.]